MNKLKKIFTKWYIKRGYEFGYRLSRIPLYTSYTMDYDGMCGNVESYFRCPRWVKPLLIFFSPSVYMVEVQGKCFVKGFEEGLKGRSVTYHREVMSSDDVIETINDPERLKKLINERFGVKEDGKESFYDKDAWKRLTNEIIYNLPLDPDVREKGRKRV